jgi:hypothetical protein
LLQDAEYQVLHEQFQTKIARARELVEAAIRRKLPFSVVLFDSWYLAEEFIACLRRRRKDWISILKKNRNLEVYSFVLKDADGKGIPLEGPHISVEDFVPLISANSYRAVQVGDQTYWIFATTVRLPSLGKVRLVISFDHPQLKGTYAVLAFNRIEWTALGIITTYLHRWPIETFCQGGKEHLGFDEYRMRDAKAVQNVGVWCSQPIRFCIWAIHLAIQSGLGRILEIQTML